MPVLPSGRRIEFSLDRFHALLGQIELHQATRIADALRDPDDLLAVLDAVHFSLETGEPYFADYLAVHWETYANDWNRPDREALRAWLDAPTARHYRAEAIADIKSMLTTKAERLASPNAASRNFMRLLQRNTPSYDTVVTWERIAGTRQDFPYISTNMPHLLS